MGSGVYECSKCGKMIYFCTDNKKCQFCGKDFKDMEYVRCVNGEHFCVDCVTKGEIAEIIKG